MYIHFAILARGDGDVYKKAEDASFFFFIYIHIMQEFSVMLLIIAADDRLSRSGSQFIFFHRRNYS